MRPRDVFGTRDVETRDVGIRDVGIREVGTREVGTCGVGIREVGCREDGTCEVGTGRWVDWAIDWTRGVTGLLVEVDLAIRSAEFVSFDHISGRGSGK